MTVDTKAERNEQFFDEYRQKRAELSDLRTRMKESEQETFRIRQQMQKVDHEISTMRKIITSMIDDGYDATQAKLVGTDSIEQNMWDQVMTGGYGRNIYLDNRDVGMGTVTGAAYPLTAAGSTGSVLTTAGLSSIRIDPVWQAMQTDNFNKYK